MAYAQAPVSNCEKAPVIVTSYAHMLVRLALSLTAIGVLVGATWLFINDLGERIED